MSIQSIRLKKKILRGTWKGPTEKCSITETDKTLNSSKRWITLHNNIYKVYTLKMLGFFKLSTAARPNDKTIKSALH